MSPPLLYLHPRFLRAGGGYASLGPLTVMAVCISCPSSNPSAWNPSFPPHVKHAHALLFLSLSSSVPNSSSPWRTPLPFFRSLSEILMPMALGPWPSHRSQVRLPTQGLVFRRHGQAPGLSLPAPSEEGPHLPTPHPSALSVKPLPSSRLPSYMKTSGSLLPSPPWNGVPWEWGGANEDTLLPVLCDILEDVGNVWPLRDFKKHEGPCDKAHSHGARPSGPHD